MSSKPGNASTREHGFTLIEIMVALLFVAIGLVTIIQVTSAYVRNTAEIEKRLLAGWVASNHIEQIRFEAETQRLKSGQKLKRVELGGYEWKSRAKLSETDVDRVYLLEVEVLIDEVGDSDKYAIFTTAVTENSQ